MYRYVKSLPALMILAILALVLAACGSAARASDGGQGFSDVPAAQTVIVRVDPSGRLAWERTAYEATAGDVTFVVENPSRLVHNFVIEGDGVRAESKIFQGGTTNRVTLKGLQPGTYRIICALPGHREAGMIASLEVR
ncbi:MAG TPA: plastocyanin/azurin family copper-binding protein [Thermomicrobiales bacterium]